MPAHSRQQTDWYHNKLCNSLPTSRDLTRLSPLTSATRPSTCWSWCPSSCGRLSVSRWSGWWSSGWWRRWLRPTSPTGPVGDLWWKYPYLDFPYQFTSILSNCRLSRLYWGLHFICLILRVYYHTITYTVIGEAAHPPRPVVGLVPGVEGRDPHGDGREDGEEPAEEDACWDQSR